MKTKPKVIIIIDIETGIELDGAVVIFDGLRIILKDLIHSADPLDGVGIARIELHRRVVFEESILIFFLLLIIESGACVLERFRTVPDETKADERNNGEKHQGSADAARAKTHE